MDKQKINNVSPRQTNRRSFLQTTVAASAAVSAPLFLPAKVLGQGGATAPNDKIIMGGIGIGNRGSFDLRNFLLEEDVHFVATCDPQRSRAQRVKDDVDKRYGNSDCKIYHNMFEFLETRTDIDMVLSTTGDRWHATAAVFAMRAGKDVYSEKPSSMTVAEGQAVVETAKQYGRIYQTGAQRLSEAPFTFCNEMLRLGRLGEIKEVRAHIAPWDAAKMRHDWLSEQPEPPKDETDWDHWLGPCPWRPYNEDYVRGRWRGHYDYHTSCIGEWGAHTFPQCQVALGLGETSGVEYTYVDNDSGDQMPIKFENGMTMILEREDIYPDDAKRKYFRKGGSCAVHYLGSDGWVACGDGYERPDVSDPKMMDDYDKIVNEYIERTGRPVHGSMRHIRNLLDCVKSRKKTVANEVVMHRSMTTVHAANICMWLGRDLKFDPKTERFVNDDEANRYLARAQRSPYTI